MFLCQWHLDIAYGKQAEALRILKEWGREKFSTSEFRRSSSNRLLVGHVGPSASHVVDEYVFASLADFEAALGGMGGSPFRAHSDALAPLVVPGSQHWEIFRIVE